VLKAIATDKLANEVEKVLTVKVVRTPAYFSYTGETNDWETSGNWSSGPIWEGPFVETAWLPVSIDDVTLDGVVVTLNSAQTIDEYRVAYGSAAASLILAPGSTLNARKGVIGYNKAGTVTVNAGAAFNATEDTVVSYRGEATVNLYGTLTTRDLNIQWDGANARAYPSVVNVYNGGVLDASRNLKMGGDDGGTFAGLDGTLNILAGGIVKGNGWDLDLGAHVVVNDGGLLQIEGDQVAVANGYFSDGYLTSDLGGISATFNVASNETSIIAFAADASGYDIWAGTFGGVDIGSATNDYDADGVINLYEYGLDGNPTNQTVAPAVLPFIVNTGSGLEYIHVQRNDDTNLVYSIETTTDLVYGTWANAGVTAWATNIGGGVFDTVTNAVDATVDKRFIRLIIEN
jgi:hypothetical protein